MIKVNFDASFIAQYHLSFSGVVARNAKGLIMVVGIIPHHFVTNPDMAEIYACIDALKLARDSRFITVIIEEDVLTIINKVHDMRAFFSSLSFSYVGHSRNMVAHVLAHEGRGSRGPRFWIEEVPPIVEQASLKENWWVNPPI
ncbi:hypothetical protein GQ457_16G021660 [Hibiscus cannabinus]